MLSSEAVLLQLCVLLPSNCDFLEVSDDNDAPLSYLTIDSSMISSTVATSFSFDGCAKAISKLVAFSEERKGISDEQSDQCRKLLLRPLNALFTQSPDKLPLVNRFLFHDFCATIFA